MLLGIVVLSMLLHAAAGDLDPSFGIGGIVTTEFEAESGAYALAAVPGGRLVAAGATQGWGHDMALARYLPNGELDATVGVNGRVTAISAATTSRTSWMSARTAGS